jgi:4-hydroxy-tetrahydrodipicolinate synthase
MEEIGKIIAGTRKDFIVWSGNDSDTLPLMSIGGYGIISVASHLVGLQIKDMINKFLAGQNAEAAAVHLNLMPLMKVLFIVSNPVPVKYALNQIGFNVGQPRLPLVEPDAKSAAQIKDVLKNYTIDLPLS